MRSLGGQGFGRSEACGKSGQRPAKMAHQAKGMQSPPREISSGAEVTANPRRLRHPAPTRCLRRRQDPAHLLTSASPSTRTALAHLSSENSLLVDQLI